MTKLQDFPFIDKKDAAKLLGVSVTTLNRWRKSAQRSEPGEAPRVDWQENVHFVLRDSRQYQYNSRLLEAWRDRQIDPHGYTNMLQAFLQAVEASQKKKRSA